MLNGPPCVTLKGLPPQSQVMCRWDGKGDSREAKGRGFEPTDRTCAFMCEKNQLVLSTYTNDPFSNCISTGTKWLHI